MILLYNKSEPQISIYLDKMYEWPIKGKTLFFIMEANCICTQKTKFILSWKEKKKKKDNQISLYTVKFYIEIALRFFLF